MTPLDVGGCGDCFFKSVSHQLYGDASHHLAIRATGVSEYLHVRTNPERFIESYVGTSWLEYLNNMSMQQTWADNIIIQAVADSMNLNIHVIESSENFAEMTVIQGTSLTPHQRSIYLGHFGELHYVSTLPSLPQTSANQIANESINTMLSHGCGTDTKKRRNTYMKNYRLKRKLDKDAQQNDKNACKKKKKQEYMKQYMKQYRADKASDKRKEEQNKYKKNYRVMKKVQNKEKGLEFHIAKFQEIVSQGPLYICTCCDQLWYKHSVVRADTCTLKQSIPDISKHLCGTTSIDSIEWLCKSCNNYLKKTKQNSSMCCC